jgi:DNA-binding CsgD family transcriptional regulator
LKSKNQNILIPKGQLSAQQKQIYQLYCEGLSNKDIAAKLDIEQRAVATQLLRIRRKAANLNHTYKIEPGAEHASEQSSKEYTANELKKKLREDPGFFKLMFSRYATNEEVKNENRYQLASTGKDSSLLFSSRVKTLTVLGNSKNRDMLVVKIGKKDRQELKDYFQKQKIRPMEVHWDDGSGVYLVTERDLEAMKQFLDTSNT